MCLRKSVYYSAQDCLNFKSRFTEQTKIVLLASSVMSLKSS